MCSQDRRIWVAAFGYSKFNAQCCVCTENQTLLNNSRFFIFLLAFQNMYVKALSIDYVMDGYMSRW